MSDENDEGNARPTQVPRSARVESWTNEVDVSDYSSDEFDAVPENACDHSESDRSAVCPSGNYHRWQLDETGRTSCIVCGMGGPRDNTEDGGIFSRAELEAARMPPLIDLVPDAEDGRAVARVSEQWTELLRGMRTNPVVFHDDPHRPRITSVTLPPCPPDDVRVLVDIAIENGWEDHELVRWLRDIGSRLEERLRTIEYQCPRCPSTFRIVCPPGSSVPVQSAVCGCGSEYVRVDPSPELQAQEPGSLVVSMENVSDG